jgi:hypothetical protein
MKTNNSNAQTETLLPRELKLHGMMGHRFLTLRPDNSCAAQANSLQSATHWFDGKPLPQDWRVFERTKKGWKEVSRA